MTKKHKQQQGSDPEVEAKQSHGSTAEETAALNATLKAFAKKYYEPDEQKEARERIKFGIEIGVAIGVALNILLTGGVLIATAWQAVYSGQQVTASRGQIEVMRDQEIRQLRAYVHITGGTVIGSGDIQAGPFEIIMTPGVKVFGQTPAGQIVVPWALVVDQWPMSKEFKFTYIKLATEMPSTSSLVPGEERPIDSKKTTISKEELAAIRAGTKRVYAYGTILYRDVFNKARFTNFCWVHDIASIASRRASDCPIHNGADWVEEKEIGVTVPM